MYPNPYMMNMIPKSSLLTRSLSTLKSIKWSTLLEGTQKTLGVINQAIPIVYQVKPIVNNAKTIFKIANSIQEEPTQQTKTKPIEKKQPEPSNLQFQKNSPIFYI